MGTAHPPRDKQNCLDETLLPDDEYTDDVLSLLEENAWLRGYEPPTRSDEPSDDALSLLEENDASPRRGDKHADDVLSLLEENARLRGLVVKLSDIILKNVADRG